mmetsp:Transcript_10601/g.10689  ORF Transcript_10601/g.10689 Transcript_10601/m.10689 type:complete len:101 (+) Transcript_10601:253-555(+)
MTGDNEKYLKSKGFFLEHPEKAAEVYRLMAQIQKISGDDTKALISLQKALSRLQLNEPSQTPLHKDLDKAEEAKMKNEIKVVKEKLNLQKTEKNLQMRTA